MLSPALYQSKLDEIGAIGKSSYIVHKNTTDDSKGKIFMVSDMVAYAYEADHPKSKDWGSTYKLNVKPKLNPDKHYSLAGKGKPTTDEEKQNLEALFSIPAIGAVMLTEHGARKLAVALYAGYTLGSGLTNPVSIELRPNSVSFIVHSHDPSDNINFTMTNSNSLLPKDAPVFLVCGIKANLTIKAFEIVEPKTEVLMEFTQNGNLRFTSNGIQAVVSVSDMFLRPL